MVQYNSNALVVCYPNQIGECGRYTLRDQRSYFKKFDICSSSFFEMAIAEVIDGDLLSYFGKCDAVFEQHYQRLFDENTTSITAYHVDKREFNRRVFDIYRYARSSLRCLGSATVFTKVAALKRNSLFDSASFVLT